MIKQGIFNLALNSLINLVRHANMLVIADRGFPFWPDIETVDISLIDDIPTVLQILTAIQHNYVIEKIYMAEEFKLKNTHATQVSFAKGRML